MTIPNVGVTGVIQKPGDFNVLGQSIGGVAQMLQQIEQMRMQNAQQQAAQRYQEGLVANQQAQLQDKRQQEEMARRQAEQQQLAWESLLASPQLSTELNPGERSALLQMGPVEGAKKLQERYAGTVVGGDSRLVTPGAGGKPTVALGVDTTPTPTARPAPTAEAMEIALGLPRDTPIESLTPEQRQTMDAYLNRKAASGAGKTSLQIGQDAFASGVGKAASESFDRGQVAAEDAVADMSTITDLRKLLDSGVIAGAGSDALTAVGKWLIQFGIGDASIKDPVARSQAYDAIVAARVGRVIKQYGSGTGLSDADREFAKQQSGGNRENTPEALRRILDIADRQARWVANQQLRAIDALPDDKYDPAIKAQMKARLQVPSSASSESKLVKIGGRSVQATLDPASGRYYVIQGGKRYWVEER